MKQKRLNLAALCCAAISVAIGTSGCIENGYDLSDIDTTTEIKVKDLVLPVNLDPVELSDIITIEEDGKIKTVNINGKEFYAVEETGSFHSDPVKINTFSASVRPLEPSTARFALFSGRATQKKSRRNVPALSYRLQSPVNRALNYTASGIDNSIHSLTYLEFNDLELAIDLTLANASIYQSAAISDLVLELPKQLKIKSINPAQSGSYGYNPSTGELSIQRLTLKEGKCRLSIVVTAADLKANGSDVDYPSHTFKLDSHFNIKTATAELTPRTDISAGDVPSDINFQVNYTVGNLTATAINGKIEYNLEGEGLNIAPIELNDLPDFLADEHTNLILNNPQIYLNINNPVGRENLSFRSGLKITSNFKKGSHSYVELQKFEVDHDLGYGPYNYCLSPEKPADVPGDFAKGIRFVTFDGLGDILSGQGLPSTLDLQLINPEIYLQDVIGLELGATLPRMEGTYKFLAPLALKGTADSGSLIVYTDTNDGWNDEDVDAITIQTLELSATVTSTIPLSAKLNAFPLDKDGHRIGTVEVAGAEIPAGASDYPITIHITGTVEHLDGITFEALVRSDGTGEALAPNQTITLRNIRAKVSGNYTKEF